jgi:hypothetical protein
MGYKQRGGKKKKFFANFDEKEREIIQEREKNRDQLFNIIVSICLGAMVALIIWIRDK